MLSAALRRNVGNGSLHYLQQSLLNALARNIAGDRAVFALAGDLIYFVDKDDPPFRLAHIEIRRLNKPKKDIFNILADISGFGKRCRIGYGKGHIQHPCKRLRQQSFADARGPEQKDIAFADLYIVFRRLTARCRKRVYTLVMVVNGDGKCPFRFVLTDNILVQLGFQLRRFGQLYQIRALVLCRRFF